MKPFSVMHIDHVVMRVSDLERSIHFYSEVLGCALVKRRDDLGLVHLRAGTAMIDLVSLDGKLGAEGGAGPGREGRNVDHVCLRIRPFDPDVLLSHLEYHEVKMLGPITRNFGAEGMGPSIYICDPDGNVIELKGKSDEESPDRVP